MRSNVLRSPLRCAIVLLLLGSGAGFFGSLVGCGRAVDAHIAAEQQTAGAAGRAGRRDVDRRRPQKSDCAARSDAGRADRRGRSRSVRAGNALFVLSERGPRATITAPAMPTTALSAATEPKRLRWP